MKKLTITGIDGVLLAESLLNVEGDNFNINLTIPIFLPILNISLSELDKEEAKHINRIVKMVEYVKGIVG